MHEDLSDLRVDYPDHPLTAGAAGTDPMHAFATWFDDATTRDSVVEPNAATMATAAADGTPSARMVLLKHVDAPRGAFTVYTNLDSRKGREAMGAGRAALCWWWPGSPARQVRVVGRVELVERDTVEQYFHTRPAAAQVGAAASEQSRAIASREELDARAARLEASGVTVPTSWGGLRIVADELEFWQGRGGRMHDRITFLRLDHDGTILSRAAIDAAGGEQRMRDAATVVVDAHATSWLRARLAP